LIPRAPQVLAARRLQDGGESSGKGVPVAGGGSEHGTETMGIEAGDGALADTCEHLPLAAAPRSIVLPEHRAKPKRSWRQFGEVAQNLLPRQDR